MDMESFFTKDQAEQGIQLPLYDKLGNKTDQWIEIYGVDSEHFRLEEMKSQREMRNHAMTTVDPVELDKGMRKIQTKLVASLIKSWSFAVPCTMEERVRLLTNAPQIEDVINKAAAQRSLFFKSGSTSSAHTPDPNSN